MQVHRSQESKIDYSMHTFLLFCATLPLANGAGIQKRAWSHLEALSAAGQVDLVLLLTPAQIRRIETFDAIRMHCRSLLVVPVDPSSRAHTSKLPGLTFAKRLLSLGRPMVTLRNCPDREKLRSLISSHKYDLIFCFRLRNFELLMALLNAERSKTLRIFVDFDDIESVAQERELAAMGAAVGFEQRLLMKMDIAETAATEMRALEVAAGVSVCSTLDAERLGSRDPTARICVVPNSLPELRTLPPRGASGQINLLFLGTMTYQPNEDAAQFFCAEVLPLVRARAHNSTSFHLEIVGRGPSSAVQALADAPDVTVTGDVDSVESSYERADIVIAPIRFGGGTRIKILEALAYGRPVVSTTVGAEGLDLIPERDILIADTPEAFADACLRLAADETLRIRLAQSGRRRFENLYEARCVQEKMVCDLKKLIVTDSRSTLV
ncbi:hypothetical protein CEW87_10495 [Parazoarcus communis]|uniref:Glycosyltransferase subfamily 4-like N-terminal domain-containing protein n=2 Tax=Parazoarcus communis TaxID=41977 RepID=A0A2U8H1E7_9RHOO|nr:hypothetical protein CEW87_10495 [Parazoarcus communis]